MRTEVGQGREKPESRHSGEDRGVRALRKFTEKCEQRKGGRELGGRASWIERVFRVVGCRGTIVGDGNDELRIKLKLLTYIGPSWLEVKITHLKKVSTLQTE